MDIAWGSQKNSLLCFLPIYNGKKIIELIMKLVMYRQLWMEILMALWKVI